MVRHIIIVGLIVSVAAFLRLYRIEQLTEFLGDQGRTGIEIYEWVHGGTLPLVGPQVLTGQYLGPAFYYLIAPSFILANFSPLGPAVFTALLGVITAGLLYLIVWLVTERRFVAASIASLYSVSPLLIRQDRILWEPNIIPFFVVIYALCLYGVYRKSYWLLSIVGCVVGVLVQLHYPNIFYIPLTLLFIAFQHKRLDIQQTKLLIWSSVACMFFLLILSPFLYYEFSHGFKDIKEVMLIFLVPQQTNLPTEVLRQNNIFHVAKRLFDFITPLNTFFLSAVGLFIGLLAMLRTRDFWFRWYMLWLVGGLFGLSLFRGEIVSHYLTFLLPVAFMVIGYGLVWIKNRVPIFFMMLGMMFALGSSVGKSDILAQGPNDIERTSLVTAYMVREAQSRSFSFTLVSSHSFSDLHYRYFFTKMGIEPAPIDDSDYAYLYLVCEKSSCPTLEDILREEVVTALCYDKHCDGEYPKVPLADWKYIKETAVHNARVYMFERR